MTLLVQTGAKVLSCLIHLYKSIETVKSVGQVEYLHLLALGLSRPYT